jgi:mycothiol system anti-sigma-R factor
VTDRFGCNDVVVRLHSYVDRELTEHEMTQVRQHLDDCPPCEQHFVFEEGVKRLVHTKGCPERAPAHLIHKILANLSKTDTAH